MSKPLEQRLKWGHLRHRYFRSGNKKRSQLLDELCDITGMNRKYLIRKLNQKQSKNKRRRGPKATYSPKAYLPP